jgi:hypothetical protein
MVLRAVGQMSVSMGLQRAIVVARASGSLMNKVRMVGWKVSSLPVKAS